MCGHFSLWFNLTSFNLMSSDGSSTSSMACFELKASQHQHTTSEGYGWLPVGTSKKRTSSFQWIDFHKYHILLLSNAQRNQWHVSELMHLYLTWTSNNSHLTSWPNQTPTPDITPSTVPRWRDWLKVFLVECHVAPRVARPRPGDGTCRLCLCFLPRKLTNVLQTLVGRWFISWWNGSFLEDIHSFCGEVTMIDFSLHDLDWITGNIQVRTYIGQIQVHGFWLVSQWPWDHHHGSHANQLTP